jgi:UDP-N-acetylmuramyl pentapeptide phosphotransferase/UDP-N-acetylglucosamine-1-phosphate transferase/protein involved in polysaccharide export with SLBB domain
MFFGGVFISNILLISYRKKLFDHSDGRKVHNSAVPRLGGLAFNPVIFFSISLLLGMDLVLGKQNILLKEANDIPELLFGFCAGIISYLMGIIDDLTGMRYRNKFIIQTLCGILLITGGIWINDLFGIVGIYGLPQWIAYPLTILVIVLIINSINLIDGIDGLASGLSGVALLFYGLTYIYLHQWLFAMLAFAALGVLIPFFYYNVFGSHSNGRKIFMGDTGSLTIGVILCILSIKIIKESGQDTSLLPNPAVLAFSPLIIPCFDLIRVFMYRIRIRKPPFLPDKNHIHHKLLAIGMSQRAAMITIVSISVLFTLCNTVLSEYININLLLMIDILIWMLTNMWLTFRIRRREQKQSIHKYMRIKHFLPAFIVVLLLNSCASTRKISYFQDIHQGSEQRIPIPHEITIQPKDKLSILVNSKDPLLANLFNLPVILRQIGSTPTQTTSQGVSGYTVNAKGYIDFPVLGEIHVRGMSREGVASFIKEELKSRNLINDPVVTVEFMNLSVSVMGEVNKPGRYNIDKDNMTILDALSMAGDLTIYGKREKILVQRNENGVQQTYEVNLCSAGQLYSSPAYYLQQNDVLYVEPNATRARQSTVNGNNIRSTSFWISLASLLTTITVLLVK